MAVRIAINGFGRIGRLVLRAIVESGRDDVEPVAINDLGSTEANAHLLRYDSVHGRFPAAVEIGPNGITIRRGGRTWGPIRVSAERDPTKVPFQGVDVAMGGGEWAGVGPGGGRGRDGGVRGEPAGDDEGDDRCLQRFLHHQLPRADGEGAARRLRGRAWLHGNLP